MLKQFYQKKNKGFTLIELLVVIAIIGLLASIVLVSLGPARARARDAKRQSDIRQIGMAMEMCFDDPDCGGAGAYCTMAAGLITKIGGPTTCISTGGRDYLNPLPVAPVNSGGYTWIAGTASQYCVWVRLEAGPWIAASPKGVKTDLTAAPTAVSCW